VRLLMVTGFWPSRANPVVGIFVLQQARAFARLGHSVTVVAPQMAGKAAARRVEHERPAPGVEVWSPRFAYVPRRLAVGPAAFALNARSYGRAARRVLARLRREEGPFDAVIVHGVLYPALSLPHWRGEEDGPAIVTLHGRDPLFQEHVEARWVRRRLDAVWEHAHAVTAVGRPLLEFAETLRVPRGKLSVVPNGTEEPLPEAAGGPQRPLGDIRRVVSVSNLVDWKGIDLNLRALAEIARRRPELRWEYVVVGDGPERGALEGLAAGLGIADRVRLLGRLPYEPTMAEIAAADVFSLPSWGEPFGIVYLEAMIRGRPAIGCRGAGAEETVRDGADGFLVEPKDVASLARALETLLADPARAAELGAEARRRARSFSWDANAATHLELLETAAASRAARRP
jgi:glycosyltransferase involved in cell wall biosynthesis